MTDTQTEANWDAFVERALKVSRDAEAEAKTMSRAQLESHYTTALSNLSLCQDRYEALEDAKGSLSVHVYLLGAAAGVLFAAIVSKLAKLGRALKRWARS